MGIICTGDLSHFPTISATVLRNTALIKPLNGRVFLLTEQIETKSFTTACAGALRPTISEMPKRNTFKISTAGNFAKCGRNAQSARPVCRSVYVARRCARARSSGFIA